MKGLARRARAWSARWLSLVAAAACTPTPPTEAARPPSALPSLSAGAPTATVATSEPVQDSGASAAVEPFFTARGSIDGRNVELRCTVFGERMIDKATAIVWYESGRALVACSDQGFTFTMELGRPRMGTVPAHDDPRLQLAAERPLCGVSTRAPIDQHGGATGVIEVSEWSAKSRRLKGSFVLEWKRGCGAGKLEGELDVVLAGRSLPL